MKKIDLIIIALFITANIFFITNALNVGQSFDNAWDKCNNIDDQESFAYFKCLDSFGIGSLSVDNKEFFSARGMFLVWIILFVFGNIALIIALVVISATFTLINNYKNGQE